MSGILLADVLPQVPKPGQGLIVIKEGPAQSSAHDVRADDGTRGLAVAGKTRQQAGPSVPGVVPGLAPGVAHPRAHLMAQPAGHVQQVALRSEQVQLGLGREPARQPIQACVQPGHAVKLPGHQVHIAGVALRPQVGVAPRRLAGEEQRVLELRIGDPEEGNHVVALHQVRIDLHPKGIVVEVVLHGARLARSRLGAQAIECPQIVAVEHHAFPVVIASVEPAALLPEGRHLGRGKRESLAQ